MRRAKLFVYRNLKEMLRDKLGYVFFLGFPVAMLVMFRAIAYYSEISVDWFSLPHLLPGIVIFAYTFVMLYTALLVAKDKSTAFLVRLYASPMRSVEYIIGYTVPGVVIGILQTLICFITGGIIAWIEGEPQLEIAVLCKLTLTSLPALLLFVFFGIIFGACFSDKAAPGVASVIISLSGLLSGAWMPLETMGSLCTFATYLPFYPAVRAGRYFTLGQGDTLLRDLLLVGSYCVIALALSIITFRAMMKKDSR